ncbi:MAG: betaine/proline/choline family ABC transporter ATP-binding protein [SAR202 cluster bacterium]|nr:betaine/proline/choline family ABC transporter ATP-binding protein [SAR202 cluster bacterium]
MALQVTEDPSKQSGSGQVRVSVRDLWKVFGPDESPDVPQKFAGMSKVEVQANHNSVLALQDVNFDVLDGETFVVMGLSGSGKSTLVRCINRLIEPTCGSVFVDQEDVLGYSDADLTEFRRKKTSMVFQQFGLLPHRSVLDNAAWGLEIQDVPVQERQERAREVLELVGLSGWEDYRPSALSGGMQQRVGLARAVASDPEILLMDEPFSALDPLIRRDMQNELLRLQEQMQKTTIFITHDLAEAVKLGTRIAIMRDGAIIQLGTPEEIVSNPIDDYVAEFTRDVRPSTVLTVGYVMDQQDDKPASPTINRPEAEIASEQTVDEALAQRWSIQGQLPVMDESGKMVGVIDRETLLKAAFEQPTPLTANSVTLHPATSTKNGDASSSAVPKSVFQDYAQNLPKPLRLLTTMPLWAWLGALLFIGTLIPFGGTGNVPDFLQVGGRFARWVNSAVDWLIINGDPFFSAVNIVVLRYLLVPLENWLQGLPWWLVIGIIALIGYRIVGSVFAALAVGLLIVVGALGIFELTMSTLALVMVATLLAVAIGIPAGIMAARNDRYDALQRPILDIMQTMPTFVYLIPVLMLFGLGKVPAIIATVIYAVPPIIRLTNLGIRQVDASTVEAARAFGSTSNQLLFKVQIPLALPTVMAGLNQTIMMALAMVVIAAFIGAKGLGVEVINGIARLDVGRGLIGGIGIVVMAVILDRITQGLAKPRQ